MKDRFQTLQQGGVMCKKWIRGLLLAVAAFLAGIAAAQEFPQKSIR